MLVNRNDDRGIDGLLMTREGYSIGLMRNHIHDSIGNRKVISAGIARSIVSE